MLYFLRLLLYLTKYKCQEAHPFGVRLLYSVLYFVPFPIRKKFADTLQSFLLPIAFRVRNKPSNAQLRHSKPTDQSDIVRRVRFEKFHDQLPLAVPCYDLLPVTKLTVESDERSFRVFLAPLS